MVLTDSEFPTIKNIDGIFSPHRHRSVHSSSRPVIESSMRIRSDVRIRLPSCVRESLPVRTVRHHKRVSAPLWPSRTPFVELLSISSEPSSEVDGTVVRVWWTDCS